MTVWILVMFFKLGYSGGPDHIEFPNKEQCERAWGEIKATMEPKMDRIYGVCVERSKGKP